MSFVPTNKQTYNDVKVEEEKLQARKTELRRKEQRDVKMVLATSYSHWLPQYGLIVGFTNYALGLLSARRVLKKIKMDGECEGNVESCEILAKDLKVFEGNSMLLPEVIRFSWENKKLSKYGDIKSARDIMLIVLKKLIKPNPFFRDKLQSATADEDDDSIQFGISSRGRAIYDIRLKNALNYGLERVWAVGYMKSSRWIVIGYDEGTIMVKIGREVPVDSMDNSGKIIWAKHNEIQTVNIKSIRAYYEITEEAEQKRLQAEAGQRRAHRILQEIEERELQEAHALLKEIEKRY
ncbi:hypothetical protein ACFE04_030940 [Oxalis oulophora]